jgi:hypothetical protein
MGCLNWRESRAEGRAEQKSSDLIPVQARDWLSRKRNPVRPPVSPVPAKPIFKEGMLEGRLDPHVQFQSPMETRSNTYDVTWAEIEWSADSTFLLLCMYTVYNVTPSLDVHFRVHLLCCNTQHLSLASCI